MKKIIFFLFLFASILVNAQTFTLSGKVIDENKEPLVGATVFVSNLKKGTSTNALWEHFEPYNLKQMNNCDTSWNRIWWIEEQMDNCDMYNQN